MKIATTSMDFWHQNNEAKMVAAGERIARQKIDFAGCTEIRSHAMRRGLERGLAPTHELLSEQKESPLAFRKGQWEKIESFNKLGTAGKHGITPTLYLVVNVFKNKRSGKTIEVITTHLVPLTLHGKKRPNYGERHAMWNEHWRVLKGVIADGLAMGHTVFVIGDFNNSGASKRIIKTLHPNAKWIIRKGLDWVFVVEGNVRVTRFGITRKFRTGSDHAGYWRRLAIR